MNLATLTVGRAIHSVWVTVQQANSNFNGNDPSDADGEIYIDYSDASDQEESPFLD
jgi:hypothetical protein